MRKGHRHGKLSCCCLFYIGFKLLVSFIYAEDYVDVHEAIVDHLDIVVFWVLCHCCVTGVLLLC